MAIYGAIRAGSRPDDQDHQDRREEILIVVHQEHSNPGRVGELLQERGYTLDRRCPNSCDPLPDDLSRYAGGGRVRRPAERQ